MLSQGPSILTPGTSAYDTAGLFTFQRSYTFANVTDGTSNTIAGSESLAGDPSSTYRSRNITFLGVSIPGNVINANSLLNAGETAPGATVSTNLQKCLANTTNLQQQRGHQWANGDNNYTMFTTLVPPNNKQYNFGGCKTGGGGADDAEIANANSNHSGGVNCVMGDGSVRFMKDSVAWSVWWALGTRAGGEVVSSDQY